MLGRTDLPSPRGSRPAPRGAPPYKLRASLGVAWVLALLASGCTPSVGDSCVISTDCGASGNLVCDTSQFLGYCTELGCISDQCPDHAACINFNPNVPGCGYSDRQVSRISLAFCMATCSSDSNCRTGYICAQPTGAPWFAMNLDANQNNHVCMPLTLADLGAGDSGPMIEPDAAVCQVTGPMVDASFPPVDASFQPPDAEIDAAGE